MLTSDQIMPAVSSLTELYSRPKTSFKVATKNQKVGLVLRKKIATAIVNLIKNGADASKALSDREIEDMGKTLLTKMGPSILNMTLLASVGVDFNDLSVDDLKQIYKGEDALKLMREIKSHNMADSEGNPIFDYFFEGTEIAEADKPKAFKMLYNRSKKLMGVSLKYLIKGIKDEVKKKHKNKADGSYIGNDLVSEIIADVLVFSLTGRDDTSDEEDVFKATGLRKKMSNRSVFSILYKEALSFRKKVAKAEANGDLILGEGVFTWAHKSKRVLGRVANFRYKVWRIVQNEMKTKTVSFSDLSQGDEGDQEARDRIVAEHYTGLIEALDDDSFDGDTSEKRELLSSAKETYEEEEEESEDTKKEYLLRILDMINSRHRQFPTQKESRFLLGNIEIISDSNKIMYKKIQGLVYARLFKMGQLTSSEIQFLDGAFTKEELDRQKRKVGKMYDLPDLLRHFESDHSVDGVASVGELEKVIDGVYEELEGFNDFVTSLWDALKYAPSRMFLKNDVALFQWATENYGGISDALNLFASWVVQFETDTDLKTLLAQSDSLSQNFLEVMGVMVTTEQASETPLSYVKELLKILQTKEALTPEVKGDGSFDLGDTQIKEFAHPLMNYSISEYPLTTKYLDAGRKLTNVSPHATITAVDLRVHRDVTDYLSTDENFKSEVEVLRGQRKAINQVVDLLSETKNFTPLNKISKENKALAEADNKALAEVIIDDIARIRKDKKELGDQKLEGLLAKVEALATAPKTKAERTNAVNTLADEIQDTFDVDFGTRMRKLYEDNMDSAIDSLLQEVINTELSDREIKGQNVLKHRARSSRVKSFIKRDAEMSVWVNTHLPRLKKGSGKKAEANQRKEAVAVASEAKAVADALGLGFDQVCKDQGLTLKKGKAQIKKPEDIRKLRSVLNALKKKEQDQTVDTYLTKAKALTEKEISDKIATSSDGLREAIDTFSGNQGNFLFSKIHSLLSAGFINKLKAPVSELKDLAESEFDRMRASVDAFITQLEDEKKDAKGEDRKELEGEIKEAKAKKSEIMTTSAFNKLLDDHREMKILENVYTFEDRLGDERMGEINKEIETLTDARDKKLATLKKKDSKTSEELEEMKLIEAGEDEEFGKKLKKKYHYRQYGIAEEKSSEVEQRSLEKSYVQYAPQVELKEESLRESARKMIDKAITENITFEQLGLGDTYRSENVRQIATYNGKRKTVLGVTELSGMASRTRSLKKLALLKKKYGDDNKFKALLDKDVDLRPLIKIVEASPECFPSVDLSLDHGLLKVYLAMPYYPQKVLVQSNGEFYGLKSENVFADPMVERNAQALMRYLLATSNPSILANAGSQIGEVGVTQAENPRLVPFYEKLLNSPSATVLKDMAEDYDLHLEDLTEEDNFADVQKFYEEQRDWWEGNYKLGEMLEAHKALKENGYSKLSDEDKAKYDAMAKVVLELDGEPSGEDIGDLSSVAFNVHQKMRYDTGSKKFFTEQSRVETLLGNGLNNHLSEGEMSSLIKDLTGSKAQKLIDQDILRDNHDSRLTGRLILNFTGLMADLNVILACASSAVSSSEMSDLDINEYCVEEVREVFGAEIGELDKIIRKG